MRHARLSARSHPQQHMQPLAGGRMKQAAGNGLAPSIHKLCELDGDAAGGGWGGSALSLFRAVCGCDVSANNHAFSVQYVSAFVRVYN